MKKVFKSALVLALGAVVLTACDRKADPEGLSKEETALKGVVEQYVPNVIYDIYGHLADETEALWGQLTALRDAASISQAGWLWNRSSPVVSCKASSPAGMISMTSAACACSCAGTASSGAPMATA